MPTKDRLRETWTGVVQKRGYPFKKKRGFKTKTAAMEWERKTFQNLKAGPKKIPLTFSQASTEYLLWSKKRRNKNTYRQKAFIFRSFIAFLCQDPAIDSIKTEMIEAYLDARFESSGGKSANRDCRELKTIFNWLIDRGLIQFNPCRKIERYKETPYIRYVPPAKDINAVMLAANGWEFDFLQCIYHTAARRVEILRLTWDDINFQTGTIKLWTKKRRGGSLEPDELIMNKVLQGILERKYRERDHAVKYVFPNRNNEMISQNTIVHLMPRLCKAAGVKPFGFHSIRHFVTGIMADSKKLSLVDIQKMLRHKRATTTDLYLNQIAESKTTAADILGNSVQKKVQPKVQPTDIKRGVQPSDKNR
jgi:integrase